MISALSAIWQMISTKRLEVLLESCHGVEGHLQYDFDYDSHMDLMRSNF
jgi:hypothetical protein